MSNGMMNSEDSSMNGGKKMTKMMNSKHSSMKGGKKMTEMMNSKHSSMKVGKMMNNKNSSMKVGKMMNNKNSSMKVGKMMNSKHSSMKGGKMITEMMNSEHSSMNGGKTMTEERHFRVVELDGKKVQLGGITLKPGQSPLNAAMKLLSSIAREKGLEKMNKLKLGTVHFSIQEYTRGSKGKVYGPYKGHFHEYTAAEKKAAFIKKPDGKIQPFKMKAVVKIMKKKNSSKKNNNK
jgi:hypothetical protein